MLQRLKNIYHASQAFASQLCYRFPSRKLTLIGVTGTDGKTTTVHLIHSVLTAADRKAALVSSIEAKIGEKTIDTGLHVTTPDPWVVPQLMHRAVKAGCDSMVVEVSSHGLDQNRVFGCHFSLGVLTNVSHEHLDYHKTFNNYFLAKAKLLRSTSIAVLNVDDTSYRKMRLLLPVSKQIITYGIKSQAEVTPEAFAFKTKLAGVYNQYNCLAAIAVGRALGLPDKAIRKGVAGFTGLPGRFEQIANKRGIKLIIDFAHKPNALKSILKAAKKHFPGGRIIAVFGAAGERDKLKRPMMGEIAAKYADVTILTAEDPRSESVDCIIEEIVKGARHAGAVELPLQHKLSGKQKSSVYLRIPDRQEAIIFAIQNIAREGDCVLLLGKGHEKSMCYEDTEYPWSEHAAVQVALRQ